MTDHVQKGGADCFSESELEAVIKKVQNKYEPDEPDESDELDEPDEPAELHEAQEGNEANQDDQKHESDSPHPDTPQRNWGTPAGCPIMTGAVSLATLIEFGFRPDANSTFCSPGDVEGGDTPKYCEANFHDTVMCPKPNNKSSLILAMRANSGFILAILADL